MELIGNIFRLISCMSSISHHGSVLYSAVAEWSRSNDKLETLRQNHTDFVHHKKDNLTIPYWHSGNNFKIFVYNAFLIREDTNEI